MNNYKNLSIIGNMIVFAASINEESMKELIETSFIVASKSPEILLSINSCGGDLDAAIHAYNMLRMLPVKINTVASSRVFSSAVILYSVGEKRYSDHCAFFIHPTIMQLNGDYTISDALTKIENVKCCHTLTKDIYKERYGDKIANMYHSSQETGVSRYFNTEEAYDCGLVTHIGIPNIYFGKNMINNKEGE